MTRAVLRRPCTAKHVISPFARTNCAGSVWKLDAMRNAAMSQALSSSALPHRARRPARTFPARSTKNPVVKMPAAPSASSMTKRKTASVIPSGSSGISRFAVCVMKVRRTIVGGGQIFGIKAHHEKHEHLGAEGPQPKLHRISREPLIFVLHITIPNQKASSQWTMPL